MARGPTWSQHEDMVLIAARQVGVQYNKLVMVMPHRTSLACRVRRKELRRMSGIPGRVPMTPERNYTKKYIDEMCTRGSQMLLEALRRHHPDKIDSNGKTV